MSLNINRDFKVPVGFTQESCLYNVFAAGEAANSKDKLTNFNRYHVRAVDAMESGKYAALNILELEVENESVPFSYYNFFDQDLFRVGNTKSTEYKCYGEISKLDFICYYYISD